MHVTLFMVLAGGLANCISAGCVVRYRCRIAETVALLQLVDRERFLNALAKLPTDTAETR